MLIPFMTIGNDFEIAHTEWKGDHTIVRFEKPDAKYCFKTLNCTVPGYVLSDIYGFTQDEVNWCVDYCKRGADLIVRSAKAGGIANA